MPVNSPRTRVQQLSVAVYIVCAFISIRLVDIQLIKHDKYSRAAQENSTEIIYQNAPRGKIITKDGVVLASNQPSFTVVYLPSAVKNTGYLDKIISDFAPYLSAPAQELKNRISKSRKGAPVKIAEYLNAEQMFPLDEMKNFYPGINISPDYKRYYPYGDFASHIIGYVGEMESSYWRHLKNVADYRLDSRVGKMGVEKFFEKHLRGKDGGMRLEVDSSGRLVRVLENTPARIGSDVILTLDYQAQKAAEEGLKKSVSGRGAVIAIDPRDGAVIAMTSSPGFDPNIFVSNDKNSARARKEMKEYNFAVQGQYEPASTFKIIVMAAAFETGRLNPDEAFDCKGFFDAGSRVFKCWEKKGHGKVSMLKGIARSCDVYFYNAGIRVGPAVIEQFQRGFRFGVPTGIPLPDEKSGNVFGPGARADKSSYWFIGDTLNLSIGQGELLVTPIQMAQFIASIANRGKFYRPQYVDKIVSPGGKTLLTRKVELLSAVNLKPSTWDMLEQGLKAVVEEGTGRTARIKGLEVFGKTGTAQNPNGKEHAWFIAFAREAGKQSKIAVCVFIENGLHGYLAAGTAREVIKAALRRNGEKGNA